MFYSRVALSQKAHDEDLSVTEEERTLLHAEEGCMLIYNLKAAGQEVLRNFGVQDPADITPQAIVEWKAGQASVEGIHRKKKVPSMWDYNQRCLPKEFVGLEPETFLVDRLASQNLCFLGTDLLIQICKKVCLSSGIFHYNCVFSCRRLAPTPIRYRMIF